MTTLVVGDSWAAGHAEETGQDNGWPTILGIPPALQQGVDGSKALDWAADVNGMLTRALATPSDRVIVCLGGNDALAADFSAGVRPEAVAAASQAMTKIVKAFQEQGRKVFVLCYANPEPRDWKSFFAVSALNAAVCASCPPPAVFIRPGNRLREPACWGGGIHPTTYGHRILAEIVNETLEANP